MGISVDEWKELIQDETLLTKSRKSALMKFYHEPEHKSTCKALGEKYKVSPHALNRTITSLAQAVQKRLNRFEVLGTDNEPSYWIIPMTGKSLRPNFEWTLRPELVQAMEECFEDEVHTDRVILNFHGPFKFAGDNSVFCCTFAKSTGVYIWVIKDELHNVNYVGYVGETTNLAKRHREHFKSIMGMDYRILDVEAAKQGVEKIVWDGMWRDKSDKATDNVLACYCNMSQKVVENIMHRDIYFAPTDVHTQLRKHIEGSLGWNLRRNYKELNVFYPDDNHIGTSKEKYGLKLIVNLPEAIAGIDREYDI